MNKERKDEFDEEEPENQQENEEKEEVNSPKSEQDEKKNEEMDDKKSGKKKKSGEEKKLQKQMQKFKEWAGGKVDDLMVQLAIMTPKMIHAGIEITNISIKIGAKSGFGFTIKTSKGKGRWEEIKIDTDKYKVGKWGKAIMIGLAQIDKIKQKLPDFRASLELVLQYGLIPNPKLQIHFSPGPAEYDYDSDKDEDKKDKDKKDKDKGDEEEDSGDDSD